MLDSTVNCGNVATAGSLCIQLLGLGKETVQTVSGGHDAVLWSCRGLRVNLAGRGMMLASWTTLCSLALLVVTVGCVKGVSREEQ